MHDHNRARWLLCFCFLVGIWTPSASAQRKTYMVLGASGAGKSTLIMYSFDVPEVEICRFDSCTRVVSRYRAGPHALPLFQETTVFDSPGLMDNLGFSDHEVMANVTSYYLRDREALSDTIDAFLLLVPTTVQRIYVPQLLASYLSAFSPSVLRSLVVVVTQDNVIHRPGFLDEVESKVQQVVDQALGTKSGLRVPVLMFNALAPTTQEQADLAKAIASVSSYKLKDLEKQREAITAIYNRMLNDPTNFNTIVVPHVESHKKNITREVLKLVPKTVEETRVSTYEVDIWNFFKVSIPKKVKVQSVITVHEPHSVTEEQEVPVVVEKEEKRRKNEDSYYWEKAVEEYEELHMDKYVRRHK